MFQPQKDFNPPLFIIHVDSFQIQFLMVFYFYSFFPLFFKKKKPLNPILFFFHRYFFKFNQLWRKFYIFWKWYCLARRCKTLWTFWISRKCHWSTSQRSTTSRLEFFWRVGFFFLIYLHFFIFIHVLIFSVYTSDNFPDLSKDEHFQVWMRTAGLPTFRKLYGKSEFDLLPGIYTITINDRIISFFFFLILFFFLYLFFFFFLIFFFFLFLFSNIFDI